MDTPIGGAAKRAGFSIRADSIKNEGVHSSALVFIAAAALIDTTAVIVGIKPEKKWPSPIGPQRLKILRYTPAIRLVLNANNAGRELW